MINLQPGATDEEILRVIESWTELLAMDRFNEAFELTLFRSDVGWTPEFLRTMISNYGSPEASFSRWRIGIELGLHTCIVVPTSETKLV